MNGGGKVEWLVVLDPVEGLVSKTDTSLAIINQARESGIAVDTATIEKLFFETHGAVIATDDSGRQQVRALDDYSLIFMRKEPPYDLAFHYATQLLSLTETLVVNSPASLRDFNEKLIALPFIEYMPPTLVSSDRGLIEDFLTRHGTGVIKALDSFQGKSVQKIDASDHQAVASLTNGGKQPVMVQKFLENVYKGDKRVMLLGDRFIGAAMRQPKQGYHANFANSEALKTELTPKEQKIIDDVGPWLLGHGIHFTGLDLIDEQLTEINITCPTGIVQISELEGRKLAKEIVDYFIKIIQ
jgi:glutathione synthase